MNAEPATMSRENFRHVMAALGFCLPRHRVTRTAAHYGLASCGLASDAGVDSRVRQSRNVALVEDLAQRQGDALLMLRGFDQLERSRQLFAAMPTLAGHDLYGVIRQIQRYLCLQTQLGELAFVMGPSTSELRLHRRAEFDHSSGCAQTLLYSISRLLMRSGLSGSACRVMLRATPPARERQACRALYGLPVRFGARHDALALPSAHLAGLTRPSAASLHYLAYNERQLRLIRPRTRWSDSVRHLLPSALLMPGTPQTVCARLLALSPRSLQRRIEAEGESFRVLLGDARRALAVDLLRCPTLRTEEVAQRLGYRQPGQFYRAFRRWFDTSPRDYCAVTARQTTSVPPSTPNEET